MKKISLKHRLLALALTLVMIFGMLPRDFAMAEESTGTTIYFDPLDEWVEAGYTYDFYYAPGADADTFLGLTDPDGNGIYELALSAQAVEDLQSCSFRFFVYAEGQSEFNYSFYSTNLMLPTDGNNLYTATTGDRKFQGVWSVYTPVPVEPTYVAETGGVKYETLAEAVAAAEPGATVKLLDNASGAGVVVNKSVTIDFGGFTYTLTEGVGSAGTPSNGLQLLAGNSVVLTNGTLKVADSAREKFYILVQNYANLTVSGMTLDGTNLDKWSATDGDSYALSINSGNVSISGSYIQANDEGALAYAFDVCQYATYPAPAVTVSGGTFVGNVDTGSIGGGSLTITGGTFTDDVSAYVAEGYELFGGSVRKETLVTPLTGGTVTREDDGTIVVTVENVTLGWSDPNELREGGWWAGIKITAPASLTEAQLQAATYTKNGGAANSFWSAKDSASAPYYMEAWMLLNPQILAEQMADDGYATITYKFSWTESDEQTVVFQVKADAVTLLQEEQETLVFNQSEIQMVYGDEVPANPLQGGTGDGAVTYEVISEGGNEIVDVAADGTVTVKKIGTVVIQATKAASGKYAEATAQYTLTVEPRPVVITVENMTKTYGEPTPSYLYSISEDGLDVYVGFVAFADDLIADSYAVKVVEAYVRENGEKSGNYDVTLVNNAVFVVKHAERTVEFEVPAPEALTFGVTEFANNLKEYPQVGEQKVTYSIVSTTGIEATINGQGKLTIDAANAITTEETLVIRAVVAQDDGYLDAAATYTLTIKPAAVPETPYTLEGDQTNGWFTGDVKMVAPEGYQIGFGTETKVPETWADFVTCTTEGENTYVYYLKGDAGITVPLTSEAIKIDKNKPSLEVDINKTIFETVADKIFFIWSGSFQVSVTFTDDFSGVNTVEITVVNENGEVVQVEGVSAQLTAEQIAAGEYIFTVSPEFRNAIVVKVTDLAGRSNIYNTDEILIADGTAPVITPEFTGKFLEVPGAEGETIYFSKGEEFGLKFTVTENHLDLSAGLLMVDTNGQKTELALDGGVAEIQLTDEGNYTVTANFTDIALMDAEEVIRHYIVDKDIPVIHDLSFSTEPNPVGEGENLVFFTNNKEFSVDITVTDTNYGLTDDLPEVKVDGNVITGLDWKSTEVEGKPGAVANLPLTEEGLHVITVTYTDGLYKSERTYKVHLDFTPAEIDVKLSETALEANGERSYYNEKVTATITVDEANFDKNLVEVLVTAKNSAGADVEIADYTALAKTAEWTKDGDVYTAQLTFTAEAEYVLTVNYKDQAGNDAEEEKKEFTIDNTVPEVVGIAYSQDVGNKLAAQLFGGFFQETTTVTLTAKDATSGVRKFIVTSSDKGFTETVIENVHKNGDTYTATLTISAQYNGTLSVKAVDWAAKESTVVDDNYLAIVDTIDPVGNFELNDEVQTAEDVKYFNGDIVMKAQINEANYAFYDDANISVTKDGQPYTGGHQTGWFRGPVATNTLTLSEDGDYVITVTYHDGSNNEMTTWTSGKLTLDTKAPVITVTNIKQNSANKDATYGFVITVTDINLDTASVKPELTAVVRGEDGLYRTEKIDLGAPQINADGETVQFTVENLEQDALYTLTCAAKDMSANETTEILLADGEAYKTVNFSINRNGSTFGFGNSTTEELVNQYFVYEVYEDVVLVEVNVDPIETYTVTLNGQELTENVDYTTTQESKEGQWSKRTYIINKSKFADEGQYNVVVSSTDKANTTAYSDIKNLTVAFVVDRTAPVLTISGLQEGGRYQTNEQTVTLIPTDEGGRLNSLKIVVMDSDGAPLTDEAGNDISVRMDLSGEELLKYLDENGGMVTVTIPTGLEMQVQIICNDCAVNNEGLTNEYNQLFTKVTVSENWFIIFYANKGAFYGTIGGVAAVAVAAVLLLRRKKLAK